MPSGTVLLRYYSYYNHTFIKLMTMYLRVFSPFEFFLGRGTTFGERIGTGERDHPGHGNRGELGDISL